MTGRNVDHIRTVDLYRVGRRAYESGTEVESRVGVWPQGVWWFEVRAHNDRYQYQSGFDTCDAARAAAREWIENRRSWAMLAGES